MPADNATIDMFKHDSKSVHLVSFTCQ